MSRNLILLIFFILCFCYSCKLQGNKNDKYSGIKYETDSSRIDIDSLYVVLSNNGRVTYREIPGQFVYLESDEEAGEYLAGFIGDTMELIDYRSNVGDRNDAIIWGSKTINIKSKLDPLSVKIYQLLADTKQYVVFIGKAQSASGSGAQVTFYVLFELNKKREMVTTYEFESRFGSINNLFDFNKDGVLDYLKVSYGKRRGEYLLTVHNVTNDEQLGTGYILLRYESNDEFIILEDHLK